jgi:hypothetical protein
VDNKPTVDDKEQMAECAQAIGLDEEYLRKIEEQRVQREELARRKRERREVADVQEDVCKGAPPSKVPKAVSTTGTSTASRTVTGRPLISAPPKPTETATLASRARVAIEKQRSSGPGPRQAVPVAVRGVGRAKPSIQPPPTAAPSNATTNSTNNRRKPVITGGAAKTKELSNDASSSSKIEADGQKVKPYLAVVVENLTTGDGCKRLRLVAQAIGPVKVSHPTDVTPPCSPESPSTSLIAIR